MTTLVDHVADDCTAFTLSQSLASADARRLGRAFAAADCGRFADAMRELDEALHSFVESRKAEGQPPERMIVALKRALLDFGGLQTAWAKDPGTFDSPQPNELYEEVFRRTLAMYYEKE
jgi:hypothetical protein